MARFSCAIAVAAVVVLCIAQLGGVAADECSAEWLKDIADWKQAFGSWKQDVCQACNNGDTYGACPTSSAILANDPLRPHSIFDHLSPVELLSVREFLLDNDRSGLNLVEDPEIMKSNRISLIQVHLPKKSEAVAYLDDPEHAPRPERRAKVNLFMGAEEPPFVGFYSVGPIVNGRVADDATIVKLGDGCQWGQRSPDPLEYEFIDDALRRAMRKLWRVTLYTYDAVFDPEDCPPERNGTCLGLTYTDTAPRGTDLSQQEMWLYFMIDVEGFFLMNTGLEMLVKHSAEDGHDFYVKQIFFRGRSFDTAEALLAEWDSDESYRVKLDYELETDPLWSSLRRRGRGRAFEDKKAPRMQEPQGPRYALNGQTLEWMDWKMHLGVNFEVGARLMDVSFKGERIAYELSLSEALATYSSISSPAQANVFYLDSAWELGVGMFELVPGLDCPEHATFLDLYFVSVDGLERRRHGVCIFEEDLGKPTIKHFDNNWDDGSFLWVSGVRATRLVISMTLTVNNYDYCVRWMFNYDGSMDFHTSASGFIQSGHWYEADHPYGTRVRKNTMGTLHDHMLSLKLDLDILGAENSFQVAQVKTETRDIPHLNQRRQQKVIERRTLQSEDESRLKIDPSSPAFWTVINPSKRNKWNEVPGYRIHPGTYVRSLLDADSPQLKSSAWAKDNVAVTVRKEEEDRSSHGCNQPVLESPYVDFDTFFNSEPLEGQDIVVWLTLGTMHLPSSEDIPNSLLHSGNMMASIKPASYFDENPITESRDSIYLERKDKHTTTVYNELGTVACASKTKPFNYDGTTLSDDFEQ